MTQAVFLDPDSLTRGDIDLTPLEADLPHLIVTPHVAWASREACQRLSGQIADNILAFRAGTPRNVVTAAD
jgi:phosphoglycerate dehydrogenase-like enzyme